MGEVGRWVGGQVEWSWVGLGRDRIRREHRSIVRIEWTAWNEKSNEGMNGMEWV